MSGAETMTAAAVEMKNISKAFGGLQAVNDVSLSIHPGEVLGIVGHNGAGKSTLIKILSGAHRPDSGEIWVGGEKVAINGPRDARALGIETLYQDLALSENLDAAANLFLGRELTKGFGVLDKKRMATEAQAVIQRINPRFVSLKEPVLNLSGGQRQSIAIARAVHFDVRVLIMDEPTAALGPRETGVFKDLVVRLREEGLAMVFISHDIHDMFEVSDRILVMAGGRVVSVRQTGDVSKDDVLGMIILGEPGGAAEAQP